VVETNEGKYESERLVIATGGLSIPKIGATDFGYRIARQFGLRIQETRPALVPLTFAANKLEELKELSGVSIDALARCNKMEFRENVLLTHRGLSGPAILQISSYWKVAIYFHSICCLKKRFSILEGKQKRNRIGESARAAFAQTFCSRVVRALWELKTAQPLCQRRVKGNRLPLE
jgi:predicted flavoprotein YhiN